MQSIRILGTGSYVLVGTDKAMEETWGSTCHGAGRALSRTAAVKQARGRRIDRELAGRGVVAMATSRRGLAEEQPQAYKDVDSVVNVVHQAGLSRKVCRLRPVGGSRHRRGTILGRHGLAARTSRSGSPANRCRQSRSVARSPPRRTTTRCSCTRARRT